MKVYNAKKLCSRVLSRECQLYSQNSDVAFLSNFLGELGVPYAIYSLVGKLLVDFL